MAWSVCAEREHRYKMPEVCKAKIGRLEAGSQRLTFWTIARQVRTFEILVEAD